MVRDFVITVKLDDSEREAITKIASKLGIPDSTWVRMIIRKALVEEGEDLK